MSALLKKQTAETHASLESMLLPHLQDVTTLADYAAILKIFYGYFQPLELSIAPFINSTDLSDFKSRRKAHYISDDLRTIGVNAETLFLATDLPSISSKTESFGALYVMEGSTLGGRGITRMLLKGLPDLTIQSLRFFNGYGEGTGPMWIAFQQALNNVAGNKEEQNNVIAAANETFLKFEHWIQQQVYNRK